jgi:ABC-type multidrug transport system ATPase subunit
VTVPDEERGLRVRRVSVAYGDREVLHEASLACRPGEMVGLLGPNGAG